MKSFELNGKNLTLEWVAQVAKGDVSVRLSAAARKKMQASRAVIEACLEQDKPIYGVSTGFGHLSGVQIDKKKIQQLQVNLLRSHAVGVGAPLSIEESRAAILLRANTLAQGHSGVRAELVDALLALLEKNVNPWIPSQGSVGASGDLAPLAHLALVVIGEGRAYFNGSLMPGGKALAAAGLKPFSLEAKEGLSLINGTQIMTAIGALALLKAERLAELADLAGAMSIEAMSASYAPFDEDIHRVRPHKGQVAVAKNLRSLLKDSEINQSHRDCGKVQDPYSLRCMPQVHGVCRDVLESIRRVLEVEINSVTDNPLVFPERKKGDQILNGGNFHGEYVAVAMDELAIAVAELANISEQRFAKLINPSFSELPAFLVKEPGLNSGFMIIHVAAASLVSENKVLCHPASVDSIPTSADKEDHVSMGTIAARKARTVVENSWNVLGMEILAAAQGLEFRKPLKPAKKVAEALLSLRKHIPAVDQDRAFYEDLERVSSWMSTSS